MQHPRKLFLGAAIPPAGGKSAQLHVPPHHLVTHGVILGMTGSGKTGLMMVAVEEALRSSVPVITIDVKGDLPNLVLAFPTFQPEAFTHWVEGHGAPDEAPPPDLAEQLAAERRRELESWSITSCWRRCRGHDISVRSGCSGDLGPGAPLAYRDEERGKDVARKMLPIVPTARRSR